MSSLKKTEEQTCNSQTFSLQFSYGIAELLCVCMYKCVYDECNLDCATLIVRIGSNGAGEVRLETCKFRQIPFVGKLKRILCILVCAHCALRIHHLCVPCLKGGGLTNSNKQEKVCIMHTASFSPTLLSNLRRSCVYVCVSVNVCVGWACFWLCSIYELTPWLHGLSWE